MSKQIPIAVTETASMYESERKIYPREINGRFQRLRVAAVVWLLGMYYVFPWLNWDDRQAVLFDLPARRFYVFGLNFWPQDFVFLAMLLIIAGLALFFFTALAGRLWCGYACPQTVWTEVFLWIEQRIEGNRNARMKLDAAPWTGAKIARKSAKQATWIVFALWTGFTFVGFFTPIRDLGPLVLHGATGSWETFWILFYGLATYGNAGILREQVCKYMCPYARFQSAMFDRDSLVISYDTARGEPRGHRKRAATPRMAAVGAAPAVVAPIAVASDTLGDCIDCLACVQVCPTGIDIRNGLQIECIACAACIDACDAVMDKMGYARGLIRYTTENMLEGKPRRIVRPRTIAYAGVLTAIILGFVWSVAARAPLIIEVLRDRNALYRTIAHGAIENSYNVKLVNKTDGALDISLRVHSELPLRTLGKPAVSLATGEVFSLPLTLRAEAGSVHGHSPVTLEVVDAQGVVLASSVSIFYAPELE